MNTALAHQVKSGFIFALVVSVVVGALGAIAEVLEGPSEVLSQIVRTCLIMVVASACGLACASLAVRRGPWALAGIVPALAAASLQTVGVWADDLSVETWQITWSISVVAVACGHLAALSLARLAPRHWWSMVLAYGLVCGIASLVVMRIFDYPFTPWLDRPLSVMLILDVAVTILIPYFHWRSRDFVALDMFGRHYNGAKDRQSPRTELATVSEWTGDEQEEAGDSIIASQTGDHGHLNQAIRPAKPSPFK